MPPAVAQARQPSLGIDDADAAPAGQEQYVEPGAEYWPAGQAKHAEALAAPELAP